MTIGKLVEPLTRAEYVEWIKALRSGKYKQGTGKLRLFGCYCCLGVLAEIKGSLDHNGMFMHNPNSLIGVSEDGCTVYHYLPMGEPNGIGLTQNTLMEMNDRGKSFDEIADFIEANMPKE